MPEAPNAAMKLRASNDYWFQVQSSMKLETIEDKIGPQIDEDTMISGGTGLLKAQAACPFSAYVKYRLKAESMEVPAPGLSAAQRGGLVHHALQYVWEILESHDGWPVWLPKGWWQLLRKLWSARSPNRPENPARFRPFCRA
jgi:hypothetical protein